jgi:hypothetical protein
MPFFNSLVGIMSEMVSSFWNLDPRDLTIFTYVDIILRHRKIGVYARRIGINPLRPTLIVAIQMGATFRAKVTLIAT